MTEFELGCYMQPNNAFDKDINSMSFAAFLGAQLLSGFLADKFGRKPLILLSMTAMSIFGITSSFAPKRLESIVRPNNDIKFKIITRNFVKNMLISSTIYNFKVSRDNRCYNQSRISLFFYELIQINYRGGRL